MVGTLIFDNRQAKFRLAGLVGASVFLATLAGFSTASLADMRPVFPLIAAGGGVLLLVVLYIVLKHPYLVLGVYGADLHKVVLDISPLFLGQPLAFALYMQSADYLVAAVAVITLAIAVLRGKSRWIRWFSLAVVSQLCLAILMTVGLLYMFDDFAFFKITRFLGGNLLMLLMSVAISRDASHVRRIWWTWLVMSLILAVGSVYLLNEGALSASVRNKFFNLSNIRTGRACATAIIYLVTMYSGRLKRWKRILRVSAIGLLGIAVLTSGSKASLVGLLVVLGLYPAVSMYFREARDFHSYLWVFLVVGMMALMIWVLDSSGFYDSDKLFIYRSSFQIRVQLMTYYVSRAFDSPLFGSGISSAYTWTLNATRPALHPHNVLIELFVEVGVCGLALFLIFVTSTLAMGWRVLRMTASDPYISGLVMATFLSCIFTLMMAQITGDIGDNRDFWLFSGLLLAMTFRYGRIKPAVMHAIENRRRGMQLQVGSYPASNKGINK